MASSRTGSIIMSFSSSNLLMSMMTVLFLATAASSLLPASKRGVLFVDAKVTLAEYNRSYASMPAMFGGLLAVEDPPVVAHLMYLKDRPLMCSSETDQSDNDDESNSTTTATLAPTEQQQPNQTTTIYPPSDGLPVALLVERGSCTFWEKSVEASKLSPHVQYIIVFDNQMSPNLVPMSSEFSSNMTLFFVSMMSGHDMRDLIVKKSIHGYPFDPQSSGILVEIDGEAPPLPDYYADGPQLNLAAYFLAAMSGFLAFLVFFGCILIFAQCGFIVAHPDERGRIVLFAGGARPNFGGNRAEDTKRLLTTEQVMSLEEIEYESERPTDPDGEEDNDHQTGPADGADMGPCCAICLDEFEEKEKARRLPCRHLFHEDCLVPWLTERHASCPMCKFDVLQHILDAEKGDDTNKSNQSDSQQNTPDGNTNSTLEAASGDAPQPPRSFSSPPHVLFWNRITFGGWSRVREDSQSEEEADRQDRRGNNTSNNGVEQQPSSEIELEARTTLVEVSTASAASLEEP